MHKVLGHQAVSTTGGTLHLLLRQRLHTLFSAQAVRSYMPRMQVRVRGGVCSVLDAAWALFCSGDAQAN